MYQHNNNNVFFGFFSKKVGSINPTVTDVDSAVVWMITRDLRRKLPALYDDVKAWVNVLHTVNKIFTSNENKKRNVLDLVLSWK